MIPNQRRHLIPWTLAIVWLFCPTSAMAGRTQDDAARAAARSAGYEGIKAFQNGDMATAVDKLGRAYAVVKVPTLGLWYARALAKTGNLVEAHERYQEVTRLEVKEGKVKEQKQAQTDAAAEADALKPRIPTLTLSVPGATDGCEVSLDGTGIPMNLMGLAMPVNPGAHRIRATQNGEVTETNLTLAEGEMKALELKLTSSAANAAVTAGGGSSASSPLGAAPSSAPDRSSAGSTQKTIGWIALGVGGVATVTGAISGILVLSKRGQLDDSQSCRGTVCTTEQHENISSYNQMRSISTAGFVVGVVGLGVGTTLLLTVPKPKHSTVTAWLGIGSIGMKGNF